MYKTLYNTTSANYNGRTFDILTFILENKDGLAVEYWYMQRDYGVMRLAYGGMLADELDYKKSIEPDLDYIANCIDWDAIKAEE
jgi:hypothetical protein